MSLIFKTFTLYENLVQFLRKQKTNAIIHCFIELNCGNRSNIQLLGIYYDTANTRKLP